MHLDPEIAPLVDAVNRVAAEAPPLREQSVEMRRDAYRRLSEWAQAGPELDLVEEVDLAGVPCRRYANDGAQGVFLFIHGGGHTIGDLETHDPVCRRLAHESAATVVSVDYRLAPEHPFPAAVEDCWAALCELDTARAADRTGKIVVGGDSAGGNLAAVLALMARDQGIDVAAQLLVYPVVDFLDDSPSMAENAEGYLLTREGIDWFTEQYRPDPLDWRASPLLAESHAGVAPAVVITAGFDPLRDQGIAYADKLVDAGVAVTHTDYGKTVHAFFQLGGFTAAGGRAVSQVANAAAAALR